MQKPFYTLLNPLLQIQTIWKHRELILRFTIRNIEMRHKGSLLGLVWAVLNPLLLLALYVFVFGFIFDGKFGVVPDETRWNYGLGIFLGLTVFHIIADALGLAPAVIVTQPNFVKKVVFPLEILPIAAVGASVFHMIISFGMVFVGILLGSGTITLEAFQLLLLVVPLVAIALGLTWTISAIGVFFRDINQVVQVMVTGLMFASAIFYSSSKVPPGAWAVLQFNPLIHFVEMARDIVLWHRPIDFATLGILYGVSFLFMTLGYAIFLRLKPAFADVI